MVGSAMRRDKKRILIVNPFGIGDVLFTTPLIRQIKTQIPDSFLGFWCNERVSPVLENNPYVDKIFSLSRGDIKKIFKRSKWEGIVKSLSLWKDLKKHNFDLAIDFSLDHRYSLVLKFLGVSERIGYNYRNRGRFLTERINIEGYEDKHIVEYYLELLKFLGVEPKEKNLELNIKEKDKIWAEEFLKDFGVSREDLLIGISPAGGASWGENAFYLQWKINGFAQLADRLKDRYKAKIIIFGDKKEKDICKEIIKLMRNKAIESFGLTTLGQFSAILKKCELLICNVTGPLHMAVALGIKTISICGPVDEKVYGPYPHSQEHIVIKRDLDCRPCYRKFKMPICPYERKCLNSITSEEVFKAVENLLKKEKIVL